MEDLKTSLADRREKLRPSVKSIVSDLSEPERAELARELAERGYR